MTVGEEIDELIKTNLEIWHRDYPIRRGDPMDPEEKAVIFLESRVLNAKRAEQKYKIDKETGEATQDFKVNYFKGEK